MTTVPVGFLAGLTGEHADTIARCVTGTFAGRHVRDEHTDADLSSMCLTVDEWRARQRRAPVES